MKLVKHLLDSKGREIISIVEDASVFDAIKLMADRAVGSLLVMDGDALKGIVTERDYARKVIIKGRYLWPSPKVSPQGRQGYQQCNKSLPAAPS